MRSTDHSAPDPRATRSAGGAVLQIDGLDVYYGQAHALQGVALTLAEGVLAVVGRNGMGKTTLCKAITGLVPASGTVQFAGQSLLGRAPDEITRLGVAYVPQGRRVWRSLTVDETLRLAAKTARQGAWTIERVYQVFPRLAERRSNGGGQLSGGEQQMLAIGRALLFNPRLLVMDEPTEGLAPVIVEQVATLLKALADERSMSVLLIEQNLGVALEVADDVAIMVNGRIAHSMPAATLAADRGLQQRLLGLKAGASTDESAADGGHDAEGDDRGTVLRLVRAHGPDTPAAWAGPEADATPRPWSPAHTATPVPQALLPAMDDARAETAPHDRAIYLAGAWGSQQRELTYVRRCLEQLGARVVTVDIGGAGFSSAQVGAREMSRHHPRAEQLASAGAEAISADTLAQSFAAYMTARRDLGGLLVVTRAETAAVGCAGAWALPAGIPKMVVSDRPLPGSDADVFIITAPIGALNRVSETMLAHAAAGLVGMLRESAALHRGSKPLVCITALDLVGPAVRHTKRALGDACDCLVLDMAADGGSTLARLASSGLLAGVIDLAPVDVSQAMVTGEALGAGRRLAALRSSGVPYVLVPSLLEVATFSLGHAVPARLLQRDVMSSALDGSVVPLSRTEADQVVEWLSERVSAFTGTVRLMLAQPTATTLQKLGGGSPSAAMQDAIQRGLMRRIKPRRTLQLTEFPDSVNDMRFGEAVGAAMRELIQNRVGA